MLANSIDLADPLELPMEDDLRELWQLMGLPPALVNDLVCLRLWVVGNRLKTSSDVGLSFQDAYLKTQMVQAKCWQLYLSIRC